MVSQEAMVTHEGKASGEASEQEWAGNLLRGRWERAAYDTGQDVEHLQRRGILYTHGCRPNCMIVGGTGAGVQ